MSVESGNPWSRVKAILHNGMRLGSDTRRNPFFALVLLLLPGLLGGCRDTPSGISIPNAERTHGAILISQLVMAEDRSELIDSDFEIQNHRSAPARIRFEGTGCTCYGVQFQGRRLERGEEFEIPAGGSAVVSIEARVPMEAGRHRYRAEFLWLDGEQEWQLPISLTVPLLEDVTVTPAVHVVELEDKNALEALPVRVKRATRDKTLVNRAPRVSGLPDCFQEASWQMAALPQEIEPGIWQTEWETTFLPTQAVSFGLAGKIQARVRFSFDDPEQASPHAYLRLGIRQAHGLRAPEKVYFGSLSMGETKSRRILLSSIDEEGFVITKILSRHDQLTFESPSDVPRPHQWVKLILTGRSPGRFHGMVQIETDHHSGEPVRIEVSAIIHEQDLSQGDVPAGE